MHTETLENCPICGGGDFVPFLLATDHTVSKESFNLTTCAACGFCVTNPRPTQSTIGKYYESKNYISHTNATNSLQDRTYQLVRKRAIRTKHKQIAQFKPQGTILDMGCGTGEFLAYLRGKGYTVRGIEPNLAAREQAISNHALDVVPDIDRIPPSEQFQTITLWHVLEHVYDVKDTLKKLHARMPTGGLLVIAVPDRESWDAQHYGANWAAYDVPRHLSHFRRRDIGQLLSDQGFQLVKTRRMWFDAAYVSILSERNGGTSQWAAMLKGVLMGITSNIVAVLSSRPASSSLYFARKG